MHYSKNERLYEIEKMMRGIPNFKERGCGSVVLQTDMRDCIEEQPPPSSYAQALQMMVSAIKYQPLDDRLNEYIAEREMEQMNYRSEKHKEVFEEIVSKMDKKNNMQDIMATEGFESVNSFAKVVNGFKGKESWYKLHAVAEYAEAIDGETMTKLASNINSFIFIPDIYDEEELGKYWIEHNDEYKLSPELEDYFLYEQFGEQLRIDNRGSFIENGYVCMAEGYSLDEILETEENEAMTMGGMAGMSLLWFCDEMWVFGDVISEGMEAEIRFCKNLNIRIRYITDTEVTKNIQNSMEVNAT